MTQALVLRTTSSLMLTLCYVVNVVDRSQVLAASVQAIKKEFGATDFQLGMLSGLPFALFYSLLGIPIAALGRSLEPS